MSTKKLCAMGLLVALTCVATMIIQIPIPATQGYVNIGDSIVLISAIFFGPQVGFVAGGLGSGLADLLSGYPQWAIATFIIKGIEGLVAGMIAHKYSVNKNFVNVYTILASVVAMVIMVVGYFLGGSVLEAFLLLLVLFHLMLCRLLQALLFSSFLALHFTRLRFTSILINFYN